MEKNISLNSKQLLLLRKCEKHLSPFGLKVMSTLMEIKNEGLSKENNLNQSKHCQSQNKRIITFNETNASVTPILRNIDNQNIGHNNFPQVSTTFDLLKVTNFHDDTNVIKETDKYIASTEFNHTLELTFPHQNSNPGNTISNEINLPSQAIPWNDIFDDEIFNEINVSDDGMNDTMNSSKLHTFNINVSPSKNEVQLELEHREGGADESKRKNTAKVVEPLRKKSKTSEQNKINSNNIYRKEKYKTTVKKWLNCVDPNNKVEPDTFGEIKIVSHNHKARPEHEIPANLNEPVFKHNHNKKTVQAQLANKGGIMKFKKPIKIAESSKIVENCDVNKNNKEIVEKTKNLKKSAPSKIIKDKRAAKFIVPIKSQLPVKDLTFDVTVVNANNFTEHRSQLESLSNCEVCTILIYSNGLSQLNSQHTDASCVSEGILLYSNDTFYYLQGYIDGCTETLRKIFSNNTLSCYEAKDVIIYLRSLFKLTLTVLNVIDVKIGSSLLNPDNPPEFFSDVQKLIELIPNFTIATECPLQKAAWYITRLKESSVKLKSMLIENGLWKVYFDMEMKILLIVAEMQHLGVSVDLDKLKTMENVLMIRMKEIEAECYKAAGKTFQINSALQVRTILYDELQLDAKHNVTIRETISRGAKSTSEAMLRSLASVHPLPKLVLEYRHLHKAHATFLAGIVPHVKDGVVKATWFRDQCAAATGRIASSNPNLQAIPRSPFGLDLFPKEGEDDEEFEDSVRVAAAGPRAAYVPRAARALLAADYRQLECRVLAARARDDTLRRALAAPDLFRRLAGLWLHKAEASVSAGERARCKRLLYGAAYGAGAARLAAALRARRADALAALAGFHKTFPSLKTFSKSVVAQCERSGGRLTLASGRARTFPNIYSSDFADKSHADRQAVNFIIQGTAADLCKTAMILTRDNLRRADPPIDGHLVLQIHDELVWEVLDEHVDRAAAIIKRTMENCGPECGLDITLPVAMYRGTNWGEMEEFIPKENI